MRRTAAIPTCALAAVLVAAPFDAGAAPFDAGAAAVGRAGPSGPADAAATQASWRAEVSKLLSARARAVRDGDEAAFMATMAGAPASFLEERRTWFRRMRDLPVGVYELEPARHTYEDLAPALRSGPVAADEIHVVEVSERIGLEGYDTRPAQESLYLTVVRRGDRWSIVGDDGLADLGLLSARNLWDFAPVTVLERDGVMVMFHADAPAARRVLDATVDAVGRVRRAWPLAWRARVVVMIPSSSRELARIFGTTIDLGPFVAFAASSSRRDARGAYALTGYRVYVQPDTFFQYSEGFQADTLGHELLHYATRPLAGAFTTSWLEEGVAQLYGERTFPSLPDLARGVEQVDELPRDYEFFLDPRARIHRSYQASAHVVRYLRDRFGSRDVARFYRAVGAQSPVSFGTDRYHLDRAAREAFGAGIDALERAWVRRLRRDFA